jgi:secreted trypsin-like serine protease
MPAGAITWGELDDGNDYPNVGMVGFRLNNQPVFICSGTLIHPLVVLTAGHCIDNALFLEQFGDVTISVTFDHDASSSGAVFLTVNEYFTHPDYNWGPQSNPHDAGVLILEAPVDNIDPAELPPEGFLDELKSDGKLGRGLNKAKFTVVGYGTTLDWPPPVINFDFMSRYYAESEYRALLSAWLRLSQNHATDDGGTCLGDSGGPAFYTDDSAGIEFLVGITSWGDPKCIATGFNYRTDITETLGFIEDVLEDLDDSQQ